MRKIILLALLSMTFGLTALEIAIDDDGVGAWCYAAPDEIWFVTVDGSLGRVYGSDFELIDTFSTGGDQPYYVYGCGRDFDTDDNIEVMYALYSATNYTISIIVRDIVTGAVDLQLAGSATHSWSASTYFVNGERFVQANRQVLGTIGYDRTVVYRSGVQHSVGEEPVPHPSALQAWPNPFVPAQQAGMTLAFSLPAQGEASVTVYNARGQRVRTLERGSSFAAGDNTLWWDGRDDAGATVSSGVYFFCVQSGVSTLVKKSIVLR